MGLITRATRIVDLCLNMDLQGQWEAATKAFDDARNAATIDAREADTSVRDAALVVRGLEQSMREHSIRFTLQARKRKEWAEWLANHPPFDGDAVDKAYGMHLGDLDEVIIADTISVTKLDGSPFPFDMAEGWDELADEMTNPQWERFALAVLDLNQGEGGTKVPFSPAASLAILRSEPTSKRPSNSGSRTSGSPAGSRGRSTSTTKKAV